MSTTRIMPGIVNMEGRQVGTILVGDMVSRHPRPRYRTTCEQCGSQSTEAHDRLVSGAAKCQASNCGKSATKRSDALADERNRVARAATERDEAERAASLARMNADTQDYERPTRYAPTPDSQVPMSERERISLREFREAEAAEEEERQRPVREAERRQAERISELQAEQNSTLRQLRAIERERIASGRDDEFQVDPATIGENVAVPTSQLSAWHGAQLTQFLADNPLYFRCPENEAAMMGYIERNAPGLKLLSAVQLTAAYRRLRDFGLLKERPAPVARPTPQPVERTAAPKPTGPVKYIGRDFETGAEREFSKREVNRMSSDDYRRAFPIIDNVKDLFAAIADATN